MASTLACIAGQEVHRQWQSGRMAGERLGPRDTPFGHSGEVFHIEDRDVSYYVLARHGRGMGKPAPHRVNDRANLYALKDLDVTAVLAWGPGGAITHNIAVGDLVVLDDILDQTRCRVGTFFEDSPLGVLRQFPVFCPGLRRVVGETLHELKLVYHGAGTAAVTEGPRLETPAEVRMLQAIGAEVVTHSFAPEVFLAKELELCYAAVCYAVNYAETGSRHRPFAPGGLFGGLAMQSDGERLAGTVGAMSRIAEAVAKALEDEEVSCECRQSMAGHVEQYDLPADWREWFA